VKYRQERKTIPGGLILERKVGADQAWGPYRFRTPLPASSAEEQFQAWVTRICAAEKIWEPIFVSVALGIWGWYVFWFLRALHEYTIVPWP